MVPARQWTHGAVATTFGVLERESMGASSVLSARRGDVFQGLASEVAEWAREEVRGEV
jgi:hypothetical protein